MFSFNSESARFDAFVTLAHISKVLNARGFATLDSMFIVLYLCMDLLFVQCCSPPARIVV